MSIITGNRIKLWWESVIESEHPPAKDIFVTAGVDIVSFALIIVDLLINKGTHGEVITWILVISVFVCFAFLNIFLYGKLKDYRRAIALRDNFIKRVAKDTDPALEAIHMHDYHTVLSNGDGKFVREMKLRKARGSKDGVFWYELGIGLTNGVQGKISPRDLTITNDKGKTLAKIPFDQDNGLIKYAVLLDPVLETEDQISFVNIAFRNWKYVWGDLVKTNHDNGKIRICFPTKELQYKIIAPSDMVFANLVVPTEFQKQSGKIKNEDGVSTIIIKKTNVEKKQEGYEYSFEAYKRK